MENPPKGGDAKLRVLVREMEMAAELPKIEACAEMVRPVSAVLNGKTGFLFGSFSSHNA
jgi:hypothetical protein